MMGSTHCAVGAVTTLGVGLASGWGWPQAVAASSIAMITSAGYLSPDVDNRRWWQRLDRLVPDELLGRGGPCQHRGVMHWWGLPVGAALCLAVHPLMAPQWMWVAWSLILGWASHLLGDFVVGRTSVMYTRRGPGIPLAPWWGHVGLGLKCGGVGEWIIGIGATLGYGALLWAAIVSE